MGSERDDSPKLYAKTALELAREGNTGTLSDWANLVSTDTESSIKNDPGQMKLLVQDFNAMETPADKKILPQLVLSADGKDITVAAPQVAPDKEVKQTGAILAQYIKGKEAIYDPAPTDMSKKLNRDIYNTIVNVSEEQILAQAASGKSASPIEKK